MKSICKIPAVFSVNKFEEIFMNVYDECFVLSGLNRYLLSLSLSVPPSMNLPSFFYIVNTELSHIEIFA